MTGWVDIWTRGRPSTSSLEGWGTPCIGRAGRPPLDIFVSAMRVSPSPFILPECEALALPFDSAECEALAATERRCRVAFQASDRAALARWIGAACISFTHCTRVVQMRRDYKKKHNRPVVFLLFKVAGQDRSQAHATSWQGLQRAGSLPGLGALPVRPVLLQLDEPELPIQHAPLPLPLSPCPPLSRSAVFVRNGHRAADTCHRA